MVSYRASALQHFAGDRLRGRFREAAEAGDGQGMWLLSRLMTLISAFERSASHRAAESPVESEVKRSR